MFVCYGKRTNIIITVIRSKETETAYTNLIAFFPFDRNKRFQ